MRRTIKSAWARDMRDKLEVRNVLYESWADSAVSDGLAALVGTRKGKPISG